MKKQNKLIWLVVGLFIWAGQVCAASGAEICSALSSSIVNKKIDDLPNPARKPTLGEVALIEQTNSNLLQVKEYAEGVDVVDADNDGQEDVFVWSIQGSGRFTNAELYKYAQPGQKGSAGLVLGASMELGNLVSPRFVRFEEVNYLVFSENGRSEGLRIEQVSQATAGKYQLRTICKMQTTLKAITTCRHPACRELSRTIEGDAQDGGFNSVEWPHMTASPSGLSIYFPFIPGEVDFDNTGEITSIWRLGVNDSPFQYADGWLLGQGLEKPNVDQKKIRQDDRQAIGQVLPGHQHDRLRRALVQQSQVMSKQLGKPVSLPNHGAFLLFSANNGRTYWGWDFGAPPMGEEIHLIYTNAKKSDYIGVVGIKRTLSMVPCTSDCVRPLNT